MAEIIVNNDYRYKGMYQNYSASLDSNIDWEPTTTNSDSNKYVRINNINFYNSAVLVTSSQVIFFIVSEQSGYFRHKYTWATSSYSYEITRSSGNGLYGSRADDFHIDTEAGVTIYYTGYSNFSNNNYSIVGLPIFNNPTDYVNYICNATTPPYNWQSVPSISGKNGILQSLVQIKESALNDGEPVSEASVTSFDSLGNINIPSVIDEQMPVDPSNPTSVTITYLIPVLEYGSYSYIKLAIKKNNIPMSLEDADRVVDLEEPTTITRIGSATVSGLDELSHYYFVIFIEDEQGNTASSEPQSCVTEQIPKFNITSIANAGTSFIVNYRINDYSTIENYRDIKLVAKANGIPSNKNDGYVIDITNNFYESQDSSWRHVDNEVAYVGLPNAESYGFKIFADEDISNSMIKETTQGTSPYIMNVLIWFSGAFNVGRPEQDRHYGYIPCYFAVPISQIDYQVGIWTDESSTKFGNFYIRNAKDGENLISQEFRGNRNESPKTFTCELSEPINGLKWLVFNDPANSGWNPAVLQLAFYTQ